MLLEYRDLRPQCLWLRSVILGPNSLKYLIHHDTSTPTLGGRVSFPVERNAHIIQPKQNTSSFCDLEVSKKIYNHQLRACSENSFLKQTNKQTNNTNAVPSSATRLLWRDCPCGLPALYQRPALHLGFGINAVAFKTESRRLWALNSEWLNSCDSFCAQRRSN